MPLVEVTIAQGRSADQIRAMMHEVHEAVLRTVDTQPEHIRVIVREVPGLIGQQAISPSPR